MSDLHISKNKCKLVNPVHDPLYKNSFYIMLTSIFNSGFGFIFWVLAAKLYSKDDVGIATALISSVSLLVLFSRFGMDSSIIRFIPTNNKSKVFGTSVFISTFIAVLLGTIFILEIDLFSPELSFLKTPLYAIFFLIVLSANSITSLTSVSFLAIRKAGFNFLQNLVIGSRIFFLMPLIFLGATGIFGAMGISFILALAISFIFLEKSGIKLKLTIDRRFLKESLHFSAGNYIAGLLINAPSMILPIMVLNILGTEGAAHYYMAFAISSILFMIPTAMSTSLFVEGSHGESLKKTTVKSLLGIFSFLTPAIIFLYFGGSWILGIIGEDYSVNGLELLRIMIISSIFVSIVFVFYSIKRVQNDIKGLVFLSGLIFILLIGTGYILMLEFELAGIGYAWVLSYGIGVLVIGMMVKREKWF